MPATRTQKSIIRRTTFTRDLSQGGLLECIIVLKETKATFKDVSKIYYIKVLKKKKVVTYAADSEIYAEANANIVHLDLLSRITMTKYCKDLKLWLEERKPLLTL